jgi:threonine/homoserine/homoserine lactone efflux protein
MAAVLIELTPGPNMTWLAVLGASQGRKLALAAVAGICLGLATAALLAGLGLTALLFEFPQAYTALRWAGTLYLFYLAWEAWTDSYGCNDDQTSSVRAAFMQGIVSNILNPKAYLFYAAVLPQFIDNSGDIATQVGLLSVIYVAIATIIHAGIAVGAGSIADWLKASPQALALRRFMAALIAAAAIWFFYSTGALK